MSDRVQHGGKGKERRTFDPSGGDILCAVPLEILARKSEPVTRVVRRIGDDVLDIWDVLREVNAAEEFNMNVVELKGIDGSECVTAKCISS